MKKTENYDVTAQEAIKYVENKYGRDFTIYGYELSDYLSAADRVFCYTEGLNTDADEYVHVIVTRRENGDVEFKDDYFGYIVRPQIEAYVQDFIESEFEDVKVYGGNGNQNFPNELGAESTLEDLLEIDDNYRMDVIVYVKGNKDTSMTEYEEKMEQIEEKMVESHRSFSMTIYVVAPDVYDSIGRYEQDEFRKYRIKVWEPDGEKWFYERSIRIIDGEK